MISANEPQPLTTSRTGGRSARLVALGIVVLLGAVIYIGVTGQSKSSPAPSSVALASPPATTGTTVAIAPPTARGPAPTSPTSDSPAQPGPGFHVIDGPPDTPRSRVATIMSIAGQAVFAATNEVDVGKLQALYAVPLPVSVPSATIDVVQVDDLSSRADNYGSYSVDLGVFHGGVGQDSIIQSPAPTVLLDVDRLPDSAPAADAPDIARNGYHIQVTGQQLADQEVVAVTLIVDRGIIFASEQYQISLKVGTHTIDTPLNDVAPGRIEGQIVIPASFRSGYAEFVLSGIPQTAPVLGRREVETITIRVPGRDHYPAGKIAVGGGAGPDPYGLTGLARNGYYFEANYTLANNLRAIEFIFSIAPIEEPTALVEPVHRMITGDDGFVGWPTAATLPNPQ